MRRKCGVLAARDKQRGVVLFIALIVLVAMALAGTGLIRSIDTSGVISGNLAFKQSTLQSADQAIDVAYTWLLNSTGATLNNTDETRGYSSSRPSADPDYGQDENWEDAVTLNGGGPDAAGNTVSYIIHRMCPLPNTPNAAFSGTAFNQCATSSSSAPPPGCGLTEEAAPCPPPSGIYYRITARSVGPRNTMSIVQSTATIAN